MKKILFLLVPMLLFSGCISEAERQARISQLNLQLEQERQRLDVPEDMWQEYVTNFKNQKCGGWEYQWGKNWREWAAKDAEDYFALVRKAEEKRIQLNIPEALWAEYLRKFKQVKCGGMEEYWGKNWRYWALKDADKDFQAYLQRQQLVERFKTAYPDNWQRKLLEYDLQQYAIQNQQEFILHQQNRQDWQNFWKEFSEAVRRANQPDIVTVTPLESDNFSNYPPNYWQELNARKQYYRD